MVQYADECRTLGIRYIFDPGQQCARMSGDELQDGVRGATVVIVNDYELELLRQKTGLDEEAIVAGSEALIVTRGEHGSSVITRSGRSDIAAVEPSRVVDPTGVGDAYRGGLMKGIALGLSYAEAARLASVAATYALEHMGGLGHSYTWAEFRKRYEEHFGPLAAATSG
jgi:adenosine kinase